MALSPRRDVDEMISALVQAYNATRTEAAFVGSNFHADVTSGPTSGLDIGGTPVSSPLTATSANATNQATASTLANELQQKMLIHFADALAHKAADTTNSATLAAVAASTAGSLSSIETLLNACKSTYNAHLSQAGVHYNNDSTNAVSTANATDLTTSEALANALKSAYNAHIQGAPAGQSINRLPM